MGVNSLPKTVARQRRGCDLNPGPSARESSTHTAQLMPLPLTVSCFSKIQTGFYRAMLCIRGTSHGPVSVRLSVRHKSEFY